MHGFRDDMKKKNIYIYMKRIMSVTPPPPSIRKSQGIEGCNRPILILESLVNIESEIK